MGGLKLTHLRGKCGRGEAVELTPDKWKDQAN